VDGDAGVGVGLDSRVLGGGGMQAAACDPQCADEHLHAWGAQCRRCCRCLCFRSWWEVAPLQQRRVACDCDCDCDCAVDGGLCRVAGGGLGAHAVASAACLPPPRVHGAACVGETGHCRPPPHLRPRPHSTWDCDCDCDCDCDYDCGCGCGYDFGRCGAGDGDGGGHCHCHCCRTRHWHGRCRCPSCRRPHHAGAPQPRHRRPPGQRRWTTAARAGTRTETASATATGTGTETGIEKGAPRSRNGRRRTFFAECRDAHRPSSKCCHGACVVGDGCGVTFCPRSRRCV